MIVVDIPRHSVISVAHESETVVDDFFLLNYEVILDSSPNKKCFIDYCLAQPAILAIISHDEGSNDHFQRLKELEGRLKVAKQNLQQAIDQNVGFFVSDFSSLKQVVQTLEKLIETRKKPLRDKFMSLEVFDEQLKEKMVKGFLAEVTKSDSMMIEALYRQLHRGGILFQGFQIVSDMFGVSGEKGSPDALICFIGKTDENRIRVTIRRNEAGEVGIETWVKIAALVDQKGVLAAGFIERSWMDDKKKEDQQENPIMEIHSRHRFSLNDPSKKVDISFASGEVRFLDKACYPLWRSKVEALRSIETRGDLLQFSGASSQEFELAESEEFKKAQIMRKILSQVVNMNHYRARIIAVINFCLDRLETYVLPILPGQNQLLDTPEYSAVNALANQLKKMCDQRDFLSIYKLTFSTQELLAELVSQNQALFKLPQYDCTQRKIEIMKGVFAKCLNWIKIYLAPEKVKSLATQPYDTFTDADWLRLCQKYGRYLQGLKKVVEKLSSMGTEHAGVDPKEAREKDRTEIVTFKKLSQLVSMCANMLSDYSQAVNEGFVQSADEAKALRNQLKKAILLDAVSDDWEPLDASVRQSGILIPFYRTGSEEHIEESAAEKETDNVSCRKTS